MIDDPLHQLEADAAERGVVFADVLKRAEVSPSTFWRWRKARFEPRASTLRKIRTSLEELTDGKAA